MGFSTKRGRPKKTENNVEEKDLGTIELRIKRLKNLTKEPIDLIKEKGLTSEPQYIAAMHFRWLYTIRFGAPGVSAMNLEDNKGRNNNDNDEEWQAEREKEYSMAVEKLRQGGALKTVMNIVVFNSQPRFIGPHKNLMKAQLIQNALELAKFREGLEILVKLWRLDYVYEGHKKANVN